MTAALTFPRENDPAAADTTTAQQARIEALGHRFDEAIALLHEVLPGFGFKLVVPPPLQNGERGRLSVSAWRRGDESARLHAAAHASDAFQTLFRSQAEEECRMQARRACRRCRGLGWYVVAGGDKAICPHAT